MSSSRLATPRASNGADSLINPDSNRPAASREPCQHFIQRAWHPDDRPTMKLDQCLVLSRIKIADHRDGVLTEAIPNAIDPRDQNEPGDPLSLSGHRASPTCPTHAGMIERIENITSDRGGSNAFHISRRRTME